MGIDQLDSTPSSGLDIKNVVIPMEQKADPLFFDPEEEVTDEIWRSFEKSFSGLWNFDIIWNCGQILAPLTILFPKREFSTPVSRDVVWARFNEEMLKWKRGYLSGPGTQVTDIAADCLVIFPEKRAQIPILSYVDFTRLQSDTLLWKSDPGKLPRLASYTTDMLILFPELQSEIRIDTILPGTILAELIKRAEPGGKEGDIEYWMSQVRDFLLAYPDQRKNVPMLSRVSEFRSKISHISPSFLLSMAVWTAEDARISPTGDVVIKPKKREPSLQQTIDVPQVRGF